jgi:two-component system, OmpR family, sensor kinase
MVLRACKGFDYHGRSTGQHSMHRSRTVRHRGSALVSADRESIVAGDVPMKRMRSITVRLSLVFMLLFIVAILLGAFGIGSLSYFNEAASQVRDRWLPSTGALGDLNNHTSDFRGIEAAAVLAVTQSEIVASGREMQQLDRSIAASEDDYRQIPHDAAEDALYSSFAADWDHYRQQVAASQALARGGDRAEAIALYSGASKAAYDAASDALDALTAHNLASARRASLRESVAYRRAQWLILITIGLAGVAAAGAMVYVRRSISAPILDLAERMHRLAANDTGIDTQSTERHDEIGEMARAVVVFRNNAIELMNSRIGLEQQATMLRERLAEEQRLMLLQRNFISMASHEFRTPITIIDGHAQRLIAMKERLRPDDLAERAHKIRNAARRMTHLIENLIDSMRVIDGDVKLYFHPAEIDIATLLQEVCQLQREIAPQAQILEGFRVQAPTIVGDANLLFQVFSNLLSNAIKYSPSGGLIKVALEAEGSWVTVSMQDRGIGIPESDRPRLFERYYRGGNASGMVGTGLGLYFVKTVVELHSGQVTVDSREGEGSCFQVRLPVRLAVSAPVRAGNVSATA